MKNFIQKMDATPTKNIYSSIIVDYDLKLAVCELIDNVIDTIMRNNITRSVRIAIEFDIVRSQITFSDNAYGVRKEELVQLISPGQSSNNSESNTIGLFGVGSKRAVVALAEQVQIVSQVDTDKAYGFYYDQSWLENGDWYVDLFETDSIGKNMTQIKMNTLRVEVDDEAILGLMIHLSDVYSRFVKKGILEIFVNGDEIESNEEIKWSYPPNYSPRKFIGQIEHGENKVLYEITGGLTTKSNPRGEYGITYYCNDRLVVKHLTTPQVGFVSGIAGKVHPDASLANVVVSLHAPAESIPWNSSKSDINYNHDVFNELNKKTSELLAYYTKLSRATGDDWNKNVFQYNEGEIEIVEEKETKKITSYLYDLPKTRETYFEKVEKLNRSLEKEKPYLKGIHETVSMIPKIMKFPISSKTRLVLIVLDSTLEIAFKEYLIYDSGKHYNDANLNEIMKSRHKVHTEIKSIFGNSIDWTRLQYFYNIRNQFVHQRATVSLDEKQVMEFEELVKDTIHQLFGSEFK